MAQVIGMRNVLIHGYFAIDTEIVWLAVTRDVPALTPTIERPRNSGAHDERDTP